MGLCKECGTRIGEKDQFCTGCGARIYKGETCESYIYEDVVEEITPAVETVKKVRKRVNVDKIKVKGILVDMLGFVLDVYTRPAASSVKYGKSPIKEGAIILSLCMAVIVGLIALWITKRASSMLSFELLSIIKFGTAGAYLKVFTSSLVSFLLLLFAMAFGLFASGQLLYNVRVKFLSLWNISVAAGMLYTTAVLISVLLSYLFPSLIMVFVVFITLILIISIYQGVKEVMGLPEDFAAFTVGVGFIVATIVVYLVGKI